MTTRRTTTRIDPRQWLTLGLHYPIHVDKMIDITVSFDGIGSATYKANAPAVFQNDADVIAHCPEIRALVVKVLHGIRRDLDKAIKVLDR